MSDAFSSELGGDPGVVGQTSAEAVPSQKASERLRQGLAAGLTFYEYLLLASLLFVSIATVKMFLNAREFGPFPFSNPYKVDEVRIGPSSAE